MYVCFFITVLKKISESLVKPRGVVGPPRMERLHFHHPEKRRAQGCYLVCSKEVKKSGTRKYLA